MNSVEEIKEHIARSLRESLSTSTEVVGKSSSLAEMKRALDTALSQMPDVQILDVVVKEKENSLNYILEWPVSVFWNISWSMALE